MDMTHHQHQSLSMLCAICTITQLHDQLPPKKKHMVFLLQGSLDVSRTKQTHDAIMTCSSSINASGVMLPNPAAGAAAAPPRPAAAPLGPPEWARN